MIVVAGAGITGLALAHELRARGAEVRVYEARERPGGVLWSERVDGVWLDLGPQRTRLTREVHELVEAVGLGDRVVEARPDLPLFVYRDGALRRAPFTPSEALRTDLLSWRSKLRALLEPFTSPPYARESVADFFERKFGREAYENLLGPLYGGLYASDPARMPARHALAGALEELGAGRSLLLAFLRRGSSARAAVPTVTFPEGLGELPRALVRELGDTVRFDAPVENVVTGPSGRLQAEVRGGGAVEARAVVLTCPADAAARILAGASPRASGTLTALTYNRLGVVHLQGACELEGYGYQVAFGEKLATRGVTWNASIFDRDDVYTAYLGGMQDPEVVDRDDDELAALAAREFEEVTGCRVRPLRVGRTRMPAWDRSWDGLRELDLPPGIRLCANYTGRPGIPGRVKAAKALAEELTA